MAVFLQGLKEAGFIEGQNLGVEQRWANNQYDRLPEMAADLVRTRVSLIAAIGNNLTPGVLFAKPVYMRAASSKAKNRLICRSSGRPNSSSSSI
jgi:hypothetical protein